MNIYVCMNLMKKVPILKDLPSSISTSIVPSLRQEIFLPNDIIVKAGTIGDCMYFIHCGTVAVYTPTGKEVISREREDIGSDQNGFFSDRCVIFKTAVISARWV